MHCPDDEVLQRVHEASADGAALAAHVKECVRCTARLDALVVLSATVDSQKTLAREGPAADVVTEGAAIGPYRVSRRLGSGAMGAVYAAWDARLEREVALKVLHLELGDLVSEARLLARLAHPNVVTVHEVLPWEGRHVLVMEFARGLTLRQWLRAAERPLTAVLDVFRQCAAGLAAAHAAGIVHRDFKPDNALVDETGRARLLDFGLAMKVSAGDASLAGSPAYLGLQQLEGAPADARSDQFAWWVSLYEALAGRLPHDAQSFQALVEVRRTQPIDLAPLPAWLRPHLARGLSNDPAARFPSMEAAARALVPPRRWGRGALAASAMAVALVTASIAVARPSPCRALSVSPSGLEARARGPALREAARDYAAAVEACRAQPSEAQAARASCLEQTGRELELALAAVETVADVPEALWPRVLRRVRPASRCERAPLPLVTLPPEADRAALLASHRAQLRFDTLREQGDADAVLQFAREHRREAGNTKVANVVAWAHLNEAAALSGKGDIRAALVLLRELEGMPELGLRERTWGALGAWMFECYLSSEEACRAQQQRALRLAGELDEPWASAWRDEVALRYLDEAPPIEELVASWGRIPGAGFEARRALFNELAGVITSDDLLRLRGALAQVADLEPLEGRLQWLVWQADASLAIYEGDLKRARTQLAHLERAAKDPAARRAFFEAKLLYLSTTRRYREALAFIAAEQATSGDKRFQYRYLAVRLNALRALGDPAEAEALRQLELITPMLGLAEREYVDVMRARHALAVGDAATLEGVPPVAGEEVLRAWQLAVLRGDEAEERRLFDRARTSGRDDFFSGRLQATELVRQERWAEAAKAAAELRSRVHSVNLEQQLRLLEAWAKWQLGERDGACRVMTLTVRMCELVPRERAWAATLERECPRIGLTTEDD